jgi:hypothetical protein
MTDLRTCRKQRLGEPEDITGAALFSTSDDAAAITGRAIVVDSGQYRVPWSPGTWHNTIVKFKARPTPAMSR